MQVGEALAPWPSYLGLDGAPAPSYNQEGRLMTPLQGWEPTGLRPGCLAHSQTGIRSAERVKLGKTQEES